MAYHHKKKRKCKVDENVVCGTLIISLSSHKLVEPMQRLEVKVTSITFLL